MNELLQHPAVQAGIAPLVVALVVAAVLWRTRWSWLGVVAAHATALGLTAGFTLVPLTAGRKVTLLLWAAAAVGALLDGSGRRWRALALVLGLVCGLASGWAFASLLGQLEWPDRILRGLGLFAFVGAHTALFVNLREDPAATGAAGVAGALALGVAGLLAASIGYFTAGIAVAAGAGALVLLQFVSNRPQPGGLTATLPLGFGLALFAAACTLLAQLPWFVLPLLALVPLALQRAPLPAATLRIRLIAAGAIALAAASVFVLAAWFAVRAASQA
jgi:hypothetical protein